MIAPYDSKLLPTRPQLAASATEPIRLATGRLMVSRFEYLKISFFEHRRPWQLGQSAASLP
jgi:hypothetical protein